MTRMIRPLVTCVAVALVVSGCANDAWKDVEPDPRAVALVEQYRGGITNEESTQHRLEVLLSEARDEVGEPYEWGADGPEVWDCSSFVRHAFSEVGIGMPRTARAQRDWMAAGNGVPVAAGEEQPGDLVFWDDYLGTEEIGHVAMVWDPAESSTIEARAPETGFYQYESADDHAMFEIWRVAELADPVDSTT
ncbi:MAG: NlpC/P60 family protein [Ornithinimicrobium sp.]